MKSTLLTSVLITISLICYSQNKKDYSALDILLIQGNYKEVIEKCNELQLSDSLNPELYYKMGLAYQNIMNTDKCLESFFKAATLDTITVKYAFSLAKQYYLGGKWKLAEPIFVDLSKTDSLNWVFGFYLSDIYMQNNLFESAMPIYERFYLQDTLSPVFLDKMAFCSVKMGRIPDAIDLYQLSLSRNGKNILSLKNLSYLYSKTKQYDTSIALLNYAIKLDSTDMDIYLRRGDVYYAQNYHFRSRPDYLRVLQSGDSSRVLLKKIGTGYLYNSMYSDAENYLLKTYKLDSSDYEVSHSLGQTYNELKQYKKSIKYYNRVLKLLTPITHEINIINMNLADTYKDSTLYTEAAKYYSKSLDYMYSDGACLMIANIYDEKLKDYDKAIPYYQLFLSKFEDSKFRPDTAYVNSVNRRLNWIVKNKKKKK